MISSKSGHTNPDPEPEPLQELPENWHYEATIAEIEAIIGQIEAGELDLADVFDQFSRGVEYLQQCEAFLNQRQQQVNLLIENLGNEAEF